MKSPRTKLKSCFFFFFVIATFSESFSQDPSKNLVLNPDFEDVTGCPDKAGDIEKVKHWYGAPFTTDYYSTCATDPSLKVPNQRPGYAEPKSGNAFAGIILVQKDYGYYDFLIGSIKDSLKKDSVYCFSLNIMLAPNSPYSVDWLSVFFADTIAKLPPAPNTTYTRFPFKFNTYTRLMPLGEPVRNTQQWVQLKANYKARGGEKHFWIGGGGPWSDNPPRMIRTFIKENPKIEFIDPDHSVYYYIDDVYLFQDNKTEKDKISIIKSPTCDDRFVEFGLPAGVTNVKWFNNSTSKTLKIPVDQLPDTVFASYQYDKTCSTVRTYFLSNEIKKLYNANTGVYPNPSKNEFTLSYISKEAKNQAEINLYSMDGREIHQVFVNDIHGLNEHKIQTEHLARGSYVVRVNNAECQNIFKIVVSKEEL